MTNPVNSRLSGLTMSVDSNRLTVRVGPGLAYLPDTVRVSTDVDLTTTLSSPTASQWRHVYVYKNGAGASIEAVTTPPTAPYQGTARLKTGDSSRRYVGSLWVDSTGLLTPILHVHPGQYSNRIFLLSPNGIAATGVGLILNGVFQTPTVINANTLGIVPTTARVIQMSVDNTATLPVFFSNPDMGTVSATNHLRRFKSGMQGAADLPLSSDQRFSYVFGAGLLGLGFVDVRAIGYFYDR